MEALEILQMFTCKDKERQYICYPWTDGEYSYATDGHTMVKLPAVPGVETREQVEARIAPLRIPKPELVFTHDEVIAWLPLPDGDIVIKTCPHCGGSKVEPKTITCAECDGKGRTSCYACGHKHKCEDCEGRGNWKNNFAGETCHNCKGFGEVGYGNVEIAMGNLGGATYPYLCKLPNVEYGLFKSDGTKAIPFRFDGGTGMVMPLQKDGREVVSERNAKAIAAAQVAQ